MYHFNLEWLNNNKAGLRNMNYGYLMIDAVCQ